MEKTFILDADLQTIKRLLDRHCKSYPEEPPELPTEERRGKQVQITQPTPAHGRIVFTIDPPIQLKADPEEADKLRATITISEGAGNPEVEAYFHDLLAAIEELRA